MVPSSTSRASFPAGMRPPARAPRSRYFRRPRPPPRRTGARPRPPGPRRRALDRPPEVFAACSPVSCPTPRACPVCSRLASRTTGAPRTCSSSSRRRWRSPSAPRSPRASAPSLPPRLRTSPPAPRGAPDSARATTDAPASAARLTPRTRPSPSLARLPRRTPPRKPPRSGSSAAVPWTSEIASRTDSTSHGVSTRRWSSRASIASRPSRCWSPSNRTRATIGRLSSSTSVETRTFARFSPGWRNPSGASSIRENARRRRRARWRIDSAARRRRTTRFSDDGWRRRTTYASNSGRSRSPSDVSPSGSEDIARCSSKSRRNAWGCRADWFAGGTTAAAKTPPRTSSSRAGRSFSWT